MRFSLMMAIMLTLLALEVASVVYADESMGDNASPLAPGQTGTAPGLSGDNPGHGGAPPGQSGTAPGLAGNTPGQSKK